MTLAHALNRQMRRHCSNFKTTPKDLGVWGVRVVHVNQTDEVLALCNTPQASLRSHAKKHSQHDSSKHHQRKRHQHNMTPAKSPKFTLLTLFYGSSKHFKI